MGEWRWKLWALAGLLAATPAAAWWPEGHSILAEAAVRCLPGDVPSFFREGGELVAHLSQDPDVMKNPAAPALQDQEGPEHFLDSELLEGRPLPATRHAFLRQCAEHGLAAKDVGLLPYAVAEWTGRLTISFAEHRKWPENPHVRQKCLFYAGILAHYSGDLAQPLHCTIHFDGRVKAGGKSPRSGIHQRVDALIERLRLTPEMLAGGQQIEPLPALFPGIVAELDRSRARIDRVYELEASLPPAEGGEDWKPSAELTAFATERAKAAARFTAELYLTAWRDSAQVRLPPWLSRREKPQRDLR